MSFEEIQAVLAAYHGELPAVSESEHYEDSEQFVGTINGERIESPNPIAVEFFEAFGMLDDSCGVCCDSDCGCC